MPLPGRPCARSWSVAACLGLVACTSTEGLTSPSPSTPWRPQMARNGLLLPPEREKADAEASLPRRFVSPVDPALPIKEEAVAIDPGHAYTLPELIDIAQRSNKQTRVAWEAARQAAITVGIALGSYLPDITAQVIGGYQRLTSPFPSDLVRQGYIAANVAEVLPGITAKWLLFDFGGRSQAVAAAEQLTIAANAEFTAVHQKLIFDVARTYFVLDAVDTQLAAAREALTNARRVEEAATALYDRGVGTIVALAAGASAARQERVRRPGGNCRAASRPARPAPGDGRLADGSAQYRLQRRSATAGDPGRRRRCGDAACHDPAARSSGPDGEVASRRFRDHARTQRLLSDARAGGEHPAEYRYLNVNGSAYSDVNKPAFLPTRHSTSRLY